MERFEKQVAKGAVTNLEMTLHGDSFYSYGHKGSWIHHGLTTPKWKKAETTENNAEQTISRTDYEPIKIKVSLGHEPFH